MCYILNCMLSNNKLWLSCICPPMASLICTIWSSDVSDSLSAHKWLYWVTSPAQVSMEDCLLWIYVLYWYITIIFLFGLIHHYRHRFLQIFSEKSCLNNLDIPVTYRQILSAAIIGNLLDISHRLICDLSRRVNSVVGHRRWVTQGDRRRWDFIDILRPFYSHIAACRGR